MWYGCSGTLNAQYLLNFIDANIYAKVGSQSLTSIALLCHAQGPYLRFIRTTPQIPSSDREWKHVWYGCSGTLNAQYLLNFIDSNIYAKVGSQSLTSIALLYYQQRPLFTICQNHPQIIPSSVR